MKKIRRTVASILAIIMVLQPVYTSFAEVEMPVQEESAEAKQETTEETVSISDGEAADPEEAGGNTEKSTEAPSEDETASVENTGNPENTGDPENPEASSALETEGTDGIDETGAESKEEDTESLADLAESGASASISGSGSGSGGTDPDSSEEVIHVSYYTSDTGYLTDLQDAVTAWNEGEGKDKGVCIDLVFGGYNYDSLLKGKLESGEHEYDIIDVGTAHEDWIENEWVMDLRTIENEDLTDLIESYEPYIQNGVNIQAKHLHALPKEVVTIKMAVNRDLFEQNDLEFPETWDEVYTCAKIITENSKDQEYGYGGTTWGSFWSRMTFKATMNSTGRGWWDPNTETYDWSQYKVPAETIKKMYQDGYILGMGTLAYDQIRDQFAKGKVGMIPAASYDYVVYTEQLPAQCDWTVIDMPLIEEGEPLYKGVYLDRVGCSIDQVAYTAADDAEKQAIADAFVFLNSDELYEKLYEAGGMIPYKPEIIERAELEDGVGEQWGKFAEIENCKSMSLFPDAMLPLSGDKANVSFQSWIFDSQESFDSVAADVALRYNAAYQTLKAGGSADLSCYAYEYDLGIEEDGTCRVHFDPAGGTDVTDQVVTKGETAEEPEEPQKENKEFLGWYFENARYDFSTPVTRSLTLTAKWETDPEKYYVPAENVTITVTASGVCLEWDNSEDYQNAENVYICFREDNSDADEVYGFGGYYGKQFMAETGDRVSFVSLRGLGNLGNEEGKDLVATVSFEMDSSKRDQIGTPLEYGATEKLEPGEGQAIGMIGSLSISEQGMVIFPAVDGAIGYSYALYKETEGSTSFVMSGAAAAQTGEVRIDLSTYIQTGRQYLVKVRTLADQVDYLNSDVYTSAWMQPSPVRYEGFYYPENVQMDLQPDGSYRISWDYEEAYDSVKQVGVRYLQNGSRVLMHYDVAGTGRTVTVDKENNRVYFDEYMIPAFIQGNQDIIGIYLVCTESSDFKNSEMNSALEEGSGKNVCYYKSITDLPEEQLAAPVIKTVTKNEIRLESVDGAKLYKVTVSVVGSYSRNGYFTAQGGSEETIDITYMGLDESKITRLEVAAIGNQNSCRNSEPAILADMFGVKATGTVITEESGIRHAIPADVKWEISEGGMVTYSWEDISEITDAAGWCVFIEGLSYDYNGNSTVSNHNEGRTLAALRGRHLTDGVIKLTSYAANGTFVSGAYTHGLKVLYVYWPENMDHTTESDWYSAEYRKSCPRRGAVLSTEDKETVTFSDDGKISFQTSEAEEEGLLGYFVSVPQVGYSQQVSKTEAGAVHTLDVSSYLDALIRNGSFKVRIQNIADVTKAISGSTVEVTFEYVNNTWQKKTVSKDYITEDNGIRHAAAGHASWKISDSGVVVETWDDLEVPDPENWLVIIRQKTYDKDGNTINNSTETASLTRYRQSGGTQLCEAYRSNALMNEGVYRYGVQVMYISYYNCSSGGYDETWFSGECVKDCPRKGAALAGIDADGIQPVSGDLSFQGIEGDTDEVLGYQVHFRSKSIGGSSYVQHLQNGNENSFIINLTASDGRAATLRSDGEFVLTVTTLADLNDAMSSEPIITMWRYEDGGWIRTDSTSVSGFWKKTEDGKWCYFYPDGTLARSFWAKSGDGYYYLGQDGFMMTSSLIDTDGDTYYVDASGARVTGQWQKVPVENGTTGYEYMYFAPETGKAYKECVKLINGKMYHFDADGYMSHGFMDATYCSVENPIDASYYYGEAKDGAAYTGWIDAVEVYGPIEQYEGCSHVWLYFNQGQKVYDRSMTIDGVSYDFDAFGKTDRCYTVTLDYGYDAGFETWSSQSRTLGKVQLHIPEGESLSADSAFESLPSGKLFSLKDDIFYQQTGWKTESGAVFESPKGYSDALTNYIPAGDETITAVWKKASSGTVLSNLFHFYYEVCRLDIGEDHQHTVSVDTVIPAEYLSWSVDDTSVVSLRTGGDGYTAVLTGLKYGKTKLRLRCEYEGAVRQRTQDIIVTNPNAAYTVRLHANYAGCGAVKELSVGAGQSAVIPGELGEEFSREGKTIVGWSEDDDANCSEEGIQYKRTETIPYAVSTENQVFDLYAVWGPATAALTFDTNGEDCAGWPRVVRELPCGSELYTVLEDRNISWLEEESYWPTCAGKTCVGWGTDPQGDAMEDLFSSILCSDMTLYAIWEDTDSTSFGWKQDTETGRYYYLDRNGDRIIGAWIEWESGYYYLDDSAGFVVTDQLLDNGFEKYYVDETGKRVIGQWRQVSVDDDRAEWMYFRPVTGRAVCDTYGWLIDGNRYAFNTDGCRMSGYFKQDFEPVTTAEEADYYAAEDGKLYTGWVTEEGESYYFKRGQKLTNRINYKITGGKYYSFGEDGHAVHGFVYTEHEDGQTWLAAANDIYQAEYYYGATSAPEECYLHKRLWVDIRNQITDEEYPGMEEVRTYFESDGLRIRTEGYYRIGGKEYYFDANGVALPGYTVTYDMQGHGEPVAARTDVCYGKTLPCVKEPVAEGYVFCGWFKDLQLSQPWDFENDCIEGNTVLYAGWRESKTGNWVEENGKTRYRYLDGSYAADIWELRGTRYSYLDGDGNLAVNCLVADENGIYYADADGYRVQNSWKDVSITEGEDSRAVRMYFGGDGLAYTGYANPYCTSEIDGEEYCFDRNGYLITGFVKDTGEKVQTPFEADFYFDAGDGHQYRDQWFDAAGYGKDEEYAELDSIRVYFGANGKYHSGSSLIGGVIHIFDEYGVVVGTDEGFTVRFEMNGHGTEIPPAADITYGALLTEPEKPAADGYTFEGWYSDPSLTSKWIFSAARVTENLTLYAKWNDWQTKTRYTVVFNKNLKGQENETAQYLPGAQIVKPEDPINAGYTFLGWFVNGTSVLWNFETDTMPQADLTLTARWQGEGVHYWGLRNGEWYYFGQDGYPVRNQWIQTDFWFNGENCDEGAYWYYLTEDGTRQQAGIVRIEGKYYLFNESRRMTAGLVAGTTENKQDPLSFTYDVLRSSQLGSSLDAYRNFETADNEVIMYFGISEDAGLKTGTQKIEIDGEEADIRFDSYGCAVNGVCQNKLYTNGILQTAGDSSLALKRLTVTTAEYPAGYYLVNSVGTLLSQYIGTDADGIYWAVKEPQQIFKMADVEFAPYAARAVLKADMESLLKGETVFVAEGRPYRISCMEQPRGYYAVAWTKDTVTYPIIWKNWNGVTLATSSCYYGDTPEYKGAVPTKPADVENSYEFDGWTETIVPVTGPAAYTAKFKPSRNQYDVIFDVNSEDYGSVDVPKVENVEYGTAITVSGNKITVHTSPEKVITAAAKEKSAEFSYAFTGWGGTVSAVAGETTITAQFTATRNKYTVTWTNWDDAVLKTEQLEYGAAPEYGSADPVRPETDEAAYAFTGWDKSIQAVTGNVTYKAQYQKTLKTYELTFVSENTEYGTVSRSSVTAEYGTTIAADGNTLTIGTGEGAPQITATAKTSEDTEHYRYRFVRWNNLTGKVQGSRTITAEFERLSKVYKVTFLNADGKTLMVRSYAYEAVPAYTGSTPVKAADAQYSYTFTGWKKNTEGAPLIGPGQDMDPVSGDVVYVAQYEANVNTYNVTVVTGDGSGTIGIEGGEKVNEKVIQGVPYGTEITAEGDELVLNVNNTEIRIKAAAGAEDAQYTYAFGYWGGAPSTVRGDCTVSANFTSNLRKYPVTFKEEGEDGRTWQTGDVYYGDMPEYTGQTPQKASTAQYDYTFKGWSQELAKVTGAAVYTAEYTETVRKYKVEVKVSGESTDRYGKLRAEGGTGALADTVSIAEVAYGTGITAVGNRLTIGSMTITAVPDEATVQYAYSFTEWGGNPGKVTGETVITVHFGRSLRRYFITFVNDDKTTVLDRAMWEYSETATPSYAGTDTPRKTATSTHTYTFRGWDPKVHAVTGEETYTAQYDAHPIEAKQAAVQSNITQSAGDPAVKAQAVQQLTANANMQAAAGLTGAVKTDDLLGSMAGVDEEKITMTSMELKMELNEVEATNDQTKIESLTYEIYPQVTVFQEGEKDISKKIGNEDLNGKSITFRVPVPAETSGTVADVTHTLEAGGTEEYKTKIQGSGDDRYVELSASSFSKFELTFTNVYYTIEEIGAVQETGSAITPAVTVKAGSETLDPSKYSVSYSNNVNPGTATVTVTIKKTGDTLTKTFTITEKPRYTITWKDDTGKVIDTTTAVYGEIPQHADPTKAETSYYTYTFSGWSPAVTAATGPAAYQATFTSTAKYTGSGSSGSSGSGGGGGGSSSGGGGGGGASGPKASTATTATYSKFWYTDAKGVWRIRNNGADVKSAWLCDGAVASNGQNVWYLMNTDGTMLAAGLVQDNTGNFYSLETNHNGFYGMLRYKNGTYNCNGQQVYLEFSQKHDGTFGAVINADGLAKLKAIYGVTKFGIDNSSCQNTINFK